MHVETQLNRKLYFKTDYQALKKHWLNQQFSLRTTKIEVNTSFTFSIHSENITSGLHPATAVDKFEPIAENLSQCHRIACRFFESLLNLGLF